jgi:hypothetical protein
MLLEYLYTNHKEQMIAAEKDFKDLFSGVKHDFNDDDNNSSFKGYQ